MLSKRSSAFSTLTIYYSTVGSTVISSYAFSNAFFSASLIILLRCLLTTIDKKIDARIAITDPTIMAANPTGPYSYSPLMALYKFEIVVP